MGARGRIVVEAIGRGQYRVGSEIWACHISNRQLYGRLIGGGPFVGAGKKMEANLQTGAAILEHALEIQDRGEPEVTTGGELTGERLLRYHMCGGFRDVKEKKPRVRSVSNRHYIGSDVKPLNLRELPTPLSASRQMSMEDSPRKLARSPRDDKWGYYGDLSPERASRDTLRSPSMSSNRFD